MYKEIYLDAPNVGILEKKYLNKAIDSGFVSSIGPFVAEFEQKFSTYLGVRRSVSTQSGTAALHMALYELGIGKGDEVIVPALTFVATANPILYLGARPVFIDIDMRTWNIDPVKIEQSITKKTKAIIPVHFYGNPCDIDSIMAIAKEHALYVVEDATESLGALYKGRHTGTFGDLGCFSFNGNKIVTTGGGGMIVGNNIKRLEHLKFLVNQARDDGDEYYHSEIGFNYRMTNVEAALGIAQMEKLKGFLSKKRIFNAMYREELREECGLQFQEEYAWAESSFWLSCVLFKRAKDARNIQKILKEKGIVTRRIFMPLVEFPPYKAYKRDEYENAYEVYERGLCLPSSTLNAAKDIRFICKVIKEAI